MALMINTRQNTTVWRNDQPDMRITPSDIMINEGSLNPDAWTEEEALNEDVAPFLFKPPILPKTTSIV